MSAEGLYATLAYTVAELAALNDPTSALYAATVAQLRAAGKPIAELDPQAVAAAQALRAGDPLQFERVTAQLQAQGYAFPGLASAGVPMTYNATELAFFREQQRRIDAGLPIITAAQLAPLTGGGMSSMFGITTTLGGSVPTTGFMVPSFTPGAVAGQGFLGPLSDPTFLGGALGTAAQVAAQIFLQRQQEKAAEDAFKRQLELLRLTRENGQLPPGTTQSPGTGQGTVVVNPDGTLGMAGGSMTPFGPSWVGFENFGRCRQEAPTVSPMDAMAIYRAGCNGTLSPRGRFYALRANGLRDLFVRVGTVNSVSPRTLTKFARRWAKQAKLTVGARSSSRRRGRARPR